jgi:aminoglycoside N3'-acetyltransferase
MRLEFSRDAMHRHLSELGIERGMEIVVHASLLAFGKFGGGAQTVLDAIWDVLGPGGGVAVPTFTFELSPEIPFSPGTTAPTGMGALSDFVWKHGGACRTPNCIHSYAALGTLARRMEAIRKDVSVGAGSFFELAVRRDLYWVMLGCAMNEGCTLVHHSEAEYGVPYRRWLDLPRRLESRDGEVEDFSYRYYARSMGAFRQDFGGLQQAMLESGQLKMVRAPHGYSLAARSAAIHASAVALLKLNPYALVRTATS